jgi:hypothetical protein
MRENVGGTHQPQGERGYGLRRLACHPGFPPNPKGEWVVEGLFTAPVAPVDGRVLARQARVYDRNPVWQRRS